VEELVLDGDLRTGQRVEQCRLADVRVAGQRDRRRFVALAFAPPRRPLLLELLEAPAQQRDPAARRAPVALELRLARAARPDAAAQTLEEIGRASCRERV